MKRLLASFCAFAFLGFFVLPFTASAECRDLDGDRYYNCDNADDELSPFAKGREEERCDQSTIGEDANSLDWDQVVAPGVSVMGSKVYPGAIEAPNSDVDYNCDGKINGYLPGGKGGDTDIMGMVDKVLTLIGQAAVFISVGALVYGGIMFATAAGEEGKLQKAKKTIIGAIVGLLIGLVAWNIVGFVTSTFGG